MKSVKILYLVRHAKSSWEHDLPDYKRPLKNRGIKDANLISNHLKILDLSPDLILTSGAQRAKSTAEIFIKNLKLENKDFIINDDLYDFSGDSVLSVLQHQSNFIDKLLVFGHNYAFTNIANSMGSIAIESLTTSGFVEIHFEENKWSNIKKGVTKTILFPKHLK